MLSACAYLMPYLMFMGPIDSNEQRWHFVGYVYLQTHIETRHKRIVRRTRKGRVANVGAGMGTTQNAVRLNFMNHVLTVTS